MFYQSFNRIVCKVNESKKVAIVGAGNIGRELAGAFLDNNIVPTCFMDNDKSLQGLYIYGIEVRGFGLIDDTLYVISIENNIIREELRNQLRALGIRDERILCYFPYRSSAYHREIA